MANSSFLWAGMNTPPFPLNNQYNVAMPKVLIIEDELELVKVLRDYLEKAGFKVVSALRGDSGLETWQSANPDLVLLDLNLPGKDGLDVAREMRKQTDTPIIMLTARVEDTDRIVGLELGADDYVVKPFSPREVVARVRAVLRRTYGKAAQDDKPITVKDLLINPLGFFVQQAGKKIDLTRTEFELLRVMASQPGRAFSRLQLLEASQGEAYEGYERTIDAHIKNLRAKLGDDASQAKYIETVFGVGYRFAME